MEANLQNYGIRYSTSRGTAVDVSVQIKYPSFRYTPLPSLNVLYVH